MISRRAKIVVIQVEIYCQYLFFPEERLCSRAVRDMINMKASEHMTRTKLAVGIILLFTV